jgi:hypothetical protein
MLGMLKRHEVEILLRAGHSKAEVARLAGVSLCSVKRIAEETPVVHVDDAAEREKRRIGRPSIVEDFRKIIVKILEQKSDLPLWRSFAGLAKQATKEARPPCTLWWPRFARKRQNR